MRAAAEEYAVSSLRTGPPPASIASSPKTSSFCSFDVKIWEELHLQSLLSSSSNEDDDQLAAEAGAGRQQWKGEKGREPKCQPPAFSFFSSSGKGTSLSGFSSPHRLSNASSQSGQPLLPSSSSTFLVGSPFHHKTEKTPVVQVIQTGSMSFTSEELVIRQASTNCKDGSLWVQSSNLAECRHTLSSKEQEESSSDYNKNMAEQSIALGSLPNAKFLQTSGHDIYSAQISPLKSAGSIPFKWEEKPGKPKLIADNSQGKPTIPSLQLPPKLLSSFPSSKCNSPYSRSNSKHEVSSLTSSSDGLTCKSSSSKSLWQSFVQSGRRSYREGRRRPGLNNFLNSDEDPSSPTSILIGPDMGLSSSSSTSSSLDALCASPGGIPEVQSALGRVWTSNLDDGVSCAQTTALMPANSSSSLSLSEASAYIGNDLPNLAPSMERKMGRTIHGKATDRLRGFLKSCQRWRGFGSRRKRYHDETEMWEPTLATYFHSMELDVASDMCGQSLLPEPKNVEKCMNESNFGLRAMANPSASSSESETHHVSANRTHDVEEVMVFSGKPTCVERRSSLGLIGKNVKVRKKRGGWALRKLKKSSKVLAALLRAVSKNTGRGRERDEKCKRRRLPYQAMDW